MEMKSAYASLSVEIVNCEAIFAFLYRDLYNKCVDLLQTLFGTFVLSPRPSNKNNIKKQTSSNVKVFLNERKPPKVKSFLIKEYKSNIYFQIISYSVKIV